nr:MFS transporter [Micromonospora sp. KC207]
MALVDVLIVNIAVPAIGSDLHASGAELQLVVGGYTVAYAMLLITGARLGDLFGRRRMYQLGLTMFTLTSLACGFAPTSGSLIVLRFLQGAGAAVMVGAAEHPGAGTSTPTLMPYAGRSRS